jgi:hypothetical protein
MNNGIQKDYNSKYICEDMFQDCDLMFTHSGRTCLGTDVGMI